MGDVPASERPTPAGDVPARTRRDACPGALQTHEAADGALARVRVPGGRLSPAQLAVIADCADELGSGVIELTSRANLQVRGLRDAEDFAARIAEAGLLPSPTHERVRNIVASPYAGRRPDAPTDVSALVEALDHALCAEPRLAELPGRFLFAIDDGSGDVAGLGADITWTRAGLLIAGLPVRLSAATDPDPDPATAIGTATATAIGIGTGTAHSAGTARSATPPSLAAGTMVAAALAFLDERRHGLPRNRRSDARDAAFVEQERGSSPDATAWRIAELADGPARIAARLGGSLDPRDAATGSAPADGPGDASAGVGRAGVRRTAVRRAGVVGQRDGRVALEVLVPLGRLSAEQVRALAGAPGPVVVTPWRSVVLLDLAAEVAEAEGDRLAGAGLVTDPGSPWAGVTACTGSPGCAKSLTDVRADATRWVAGLTEPLGTPVHWAGCERRCGRPRGEVIERVATHDGTPTNHGTAAHDGDAGDDGYLERRT